MYVDEHNRPLTFDDLTQAVRRSAGLGQTLDQLNQLPQSPPAGGDLSALILATAAGEANAPGVPLSNMPLASNYGQLNPASPNYDPFAVQLAAAGTPFSPPWWLLGVVVVGVFLIAGKK